MQMYANLCSFAESLEGSLGRSLDPTLGSTSLFGPLISSPYFSLPGASASLQWHFPRTPQGVWEDKKAESPGRERKRHSFKLGMTAWESGKRANSLPVCKSLFSPRCQNHQLLDGSLLPSFWNNLSRALGSPAKQAVGRWLCGPPLPISSQSPLSSHKAGLLKCQMGDTNSPALLSIHRSHSLLLEHISSRLLLSNLRVSHGRCEPQSNLKEKPVGLTLKKCGANWEEMVPKSKCQCVTQRRDCSLDSSCLYCC